MPPRLTCGAKLPLSALSCPPPSLPKPATPSLTQCIVWEVHTSPSPPPKAIVWDVIDASNPYRVRWDYLLLLTMVYIVVCTPYYIAFNVDTVGEEEGGRRGERGGG